MRASSIADTKIRKSYHVRKLFGSFLFLLPSDYVIGDGRFLKMGYRVQGTINMRTAVGGYEMMNQKSYILIIYT